MALDLNATVKDYSLILYNKTEIDDKLSTEQTRVNDELDLRSLKSDEGAPSGIATLNEDGNISLIQLPIASVAESSDTSNNITLITPEKLALQLESRAVLTTAVGVASGVAPLDVNGKVSETYLPPAQNVQTFVVELLTDMYNITTALEGDRCVVTSEGNSADNGEYVANRDYPSDSAGWDQLPNLSTVQSVNGLTGNVVITSITESAANAGRLDVVENDLNETTLGIKDRLTQAETDITTNAGNITTNTTKLDLFTITQAANIDNMVTNITSNTNALTTKADQTSLDTTNTAVGLNTDFRLSRTYDYGNITDHTVFGDIFEQINRVTTPSRDAGVYELTLSMIYTIDSITNAAFFRFSTDGGSTWTEVRKESKDVADKIAECYVTVDAFAGGVKDIIVQARKENANDVLTILDQTIIYQRKA